MRTRAADWVRQRAERIDAVHAKQALAVVSPAKSKVGRWQVQAARLRALAERRRQSGEALEAIIDEARAAVAEIDAQLRSLEERSAELPPEVVQHSRFQDVVRATDTASAAMRSVLAATGQRGSHRHH